MGKRPKQTFLRRRHTDGQQTHENILHIICHPKKCKLKQRDTTAHLVESPKYRALTTPSAGEDVEQQELPFIAGGTQNCTATLGDSLSVSYKNKRTLIVCSSNYVPWYLPKGVEKLCPYKKTCTRMFIAALFIIVKTWKQPKMSFTR